MRREGTVPRTEETAKKIRAPLIMFAEGIHTVVIKDTLPHSKVDLAMNVYDKASAEDIRAGLRVASKKLLGTDLLAKDLLPSTPSPSEAARVRRKSCGCNEEW